MNPALETLKERGLLQQCTDLDALSTALKALTDKVHPLALGNVHRQYLLIRSLSKRLLELHMKGEDEKIEKIIELLSEKLYYHGYEISRHEAKEIIGLNVVYPKENIENLIWDLFSDYRTALPIGEEFDFNSMMGGRESADFVLDSAVIESERILHSFAFSVNIKRRKQGTLEFDVNVKKQGWETLGGK